MKKILAVMILLVLQLQVFGATIPSGTAVVVRTEHEIDADRVKLGDSVNFVVEQNVKVNGETVIKMGSSVQGKVVKRKNNGILGIAGELEIGDFKLISADNGEVIRLSGTIADKGEARYWANIGWLFVFPLLFVKGNDGKFPMNYSKILYTIQDVEL